MRQRCIPLRIAAQDAADQPHLACNHGHGSDFVRHRAVRFDGHPKLPLAGVEDVTLHALGCLPPPSCRALATSTIRLHRVPLELLRDQLRGDRSGPVRRALRDLDLRAESIVEVDAHTCSAATASNSRPKCSYPALAGWISSFPVARRPPHSQPGIGAETRGRGRQGWPETGQECTRRRLEERR